MKRSQPQYFSDHFNIDKAKLKELGVFDPILNFDTKLFVEPLLLKKSSNETIRNAAKTFDQFFIDLLILIKISKQEDDRPWRQAQRIVKFPEYKYTCIGYGSDSINGSGSGAWLNDKILQSAKEIVNLGIGGDNPAINNASISLGATEIFKKTTGRKTGIVEIASNDGNLSEEQNLNNLLNSGSINVVGNISNQTVIAN
jgi:hypothetical protein